MTHDRRRPRTSRPTAALLGITSLRVLLVPRYEILMALYDRADFHAVVYVNNGWTNFQSLSFQQAVHIHVNHGESDKICMVSNQAKAYDKVFVAGEAAVRRHAAALAWFDPEPPRQGRTPAARPARARRRCPTIDGADDHLRAHLGGRGRRQQLHVGRPLRAADHRRGAGPARRARPVQAAPARRHVRGFRGRQGPRADRAGSIEQATRGASRGAGTRCCCRATFSASSAAPTS